MAAERRGCRRERRCFTLPDSADSGTVGGFWDGKRASEALEVSIDCDLVLDRTRPYRVAPFVSV
eukprot:4834665-Prymnesium_polylepis.1